MAVIRGVCDKCMKDKKIEDLTRITVLEKTYDEDKWDSVYNAFDLCVDCYDTWVKTIPRLK